MITANGHWQLGFSISANQHEEDKFKMVMDFNEDALEFLPCSETVNEQLLYDEKRTL